MRIRTAHNKRIHRGIFALCVVLFVFCQSASAQGDALLTQYWEMPTYYNPASAGATDFLRFRGDARLQWVGMEASPRTIVASADAPFKFLGKKWGVGVVVQHQKVGLYRNINVGAQLGYKMNLFKGELTLALQLGYIDEEYRGSEFVPDGGGDDGTEGVEEGIKSQQVADLPTTDLSGGAMDLGLGVNYRRGGTWFGVSLQHANKPTVTFTSATGDGSEQAMQNKGIGYAGRLNRSEDVESEKEDFAFNTPRLLYFTAGSNIQVKNTLLELIPSMLVRTDFTNTDFVLTGRARYKKLISAGVGYRYRDAISVMLAVEYQGFFLGYDYDINTGSKGKGSSGSHEILAGYSLKLDFGEKNRFKQKSIRIL